MSRPLHIVALLPLLFGLSASAFASPAAAMSAKQAASTPPATAPAQITPIEMGMRRLVRLQRELHWLAADSLADSLVALAATDAANLPRLRAGAELVHLRSAWGRKAYRDTSAVMHGHQALALLRALTPIDTLMLADAHLSLGRVLWETDHPDEGLANVDRSRELRAAKLGPRDTLVAEAWYERGFSLQQRGQPEAALVAFDSALVIQRAAFGTEGVKPAQSEGQRGIALLDLRRFAEARSEFTHAIAAVERRQGPEGPALQFPLLGLSRLEEEAGDLATAIDLQERALAIAKKRYARNPIATMPMHGNLGIQRLTLGDAEGARREFEIAWAGFAKQFGEENSRTAESSAYLGIAAAQLGDTATAWRRLRAARAVFEQADDPPAEEWMQALRWEAELLARAGNAKAALALSATALHRSDSLTGIPAALLVEIHALRVRLQSATRDTAALAASVRALTALLDHPGVRETPAHAELLLTRSQALAALGRHAAAWSDALAAEAFAREQLRLNARALPDRQALGLAASLDEPCLQLARLARTGDAAEVREAWSRIADWHGLVNDEVARRRVPHAALADTALANAWTHRNEANLALAQVLVNGAHAGRDAHWREAHALATSAAEDAERALARFARAPIASTAAPLARVLEHLDPRDALVTFVADDASGDASGAGHLLAFVARSGHAPRLADLGALATLEPAIAAWRRAIATPPGTAGAVSRARAQALGAAVRARVWDTLAPVLIGATRVDIVEDGVVTALPWQALPFTDGRVLAEREPLVRVLSAERRRLEAEPVVQGSLLALGGADFGTAAPSSNAAAAAVSLRGHDDCGAWPVFTALPSTRTEAEAVAALWRETPGSAGAKVLTGAAATEQAFMGEASGHAVLHLATHGFVLRDTCGTSVPGLRGVGGVAALEPAPGRRARKATSAERAPRANDALGGRRVWLALAGANVPDVAERDGLLTAEEVATLDLAGTDWVVLSACHSALAEQWTRQGAQGMARAFQLAGAHTVIASQWSVSDTATLEWMRALYAARMHGARGAAEAMRQATRTVLVARRARGEDSHPFYWAAFSANER